MNDDVVVDVNVDVDVVGRGGDPGAGAKERHRGRRPLRTALVWEDALGRAAVVGAAAAARKVAYLHGALFRHDGLTTGTGAGRVRVPDYHVDVAPLGRLLVHAAAAAGRRAPFHTDEAVKGRVCAQCVRTRECQPLFPHNREIDTTRK